MDNHGCNLELMLFSWRNGRDRTNTECHVGIKIHPDQVPITDTKADSKVVQSANSYRFDRHRLMCSPVHGLYTPCSRIRRYKAGFLVKNIAKNKVQLCTY